MSVVTLPELGGVVAGRVVGAEVFGGVGGENGAGDESGNESESENESLSESGGTGGSQSESGEGKKYEERLVPGKGRSLFLKQDHHLKAGDTLLTDHPSLLLARDALEVLLPEERHRLNWLGVMQLPDKARRGVRELSSTARYADEVDGQVAVNALGVQVGGFRHLGVFPETAVCPPPSPCPRPFLPFLASPSSADLTAENKPRLYTKVRPPTAYSIPHFSLLNLLTLQSLYYRFNETTLTLTLFALRDILPGEELSYSYLDPLSTPHHKDRHAALSSQWGFTCTCPICADPSSRAASDRRREEIRGLKPQLADSASDPRRIVRLCRELLRLYEEEGAVVPRGMVAEMAAYTANKAGDAQAAVRFAQTAREAWGVVAGEGSVEVKRIEGLIKDPRGHGSYEPGEGLGEEMEEGWGEKRGDVVGDAIREAMRGAKKKAREGGVAEEEEEEMVEEAVRAALRGMSWDEL